MEPSGFEEKERGQPKQSRKHSTLDWERKTRLGLSLVEIHGRQSMLTKVLSDNGLRRILISLGSPRRAIPQTWLSRKTDRLCKGLTDSWSYQIQLPRLV